MFSELKGLVSLYEHDSTHLLRRPPIHMAEFKLAPYFVKIFVLGECSRCPFPHQLHPRISIIPPIGLIVDGKESIDVRDGRVSV